MKKAPLHPNEEQRIKALEDLDILDTEAEVDFDNLVSLASQICETPISLISLVDKERQWFKAKTGLDASETHRDLAFCAHAILDTKIFEIENSNNDERFSDNPLVTGEPRVIFYAGIPIYSPDQQPIGTLCVIDHKPKKLSEAQSNALKALGQQANRLIELRSKIIELKRLHYHLQFQNAAFENMTEGIVVQDRAGKILNFNQAACDVLGLTADQLTGKTSMDAGWRCIKEDGSQFLGQDHPAMVTLSTGVTLKNVLMGVHTPTSELKWISINSIPLFLDKQSSASHSVTTFADVTEERKSQLALIESAKMSSLGEMAGGIAHEINTPLAIISGAAELISHYISEPEVDRDKIRARLEKIENTSQRISRIVKGLRAFARNSEDDEAIATSLTQTVDETLSLCSERFKNAQVRVEFSAQEDAEVNVVPTQLSQVLLNLLNNSYDAISDLDDKWIQVELFKIYKEHGVPAVRLIVTDSGRGIGKEFRDKIMMPFFTTKEIGKGTGLGLSISKGIIEKFSGKLYYDPNSVHTKFVIELPLLLPNKNTQDKISA